MPTYFQIPAPESAELWRIDGQHIYVVYYAPGTKIPMAWHVENPDQLTAITGGTQTSWDRDLTRQQFERAGGLDFGGSKELANLTDHPFEAFEREYEVQAEVQPWLRDPEIRAIFLGALLEGRQPTPAEIQTTDWWRNHNDAQRAWISLHASDPATARQTAESNRRRVRDALTESGVASPPGWLVGAIANPYSRGELSDAQLADSVRAVSDPYFRAKLPGVVQKALRDRDLSAIDTTQAGEDQVRALVQTYLGPRYGNWDQDKVARWAGRLRNDPDAERALTSRLQSQLQKLYGQSGETWDPTTTWDDLASPWISMAQSTWGQSINPADDVVDRLIRLNDASEANQFLLREGIKRNIGTVVNSTLSDMASAFDLNVRRMI